MSVENVVFTTDGLFFTLGNMIPPFLESGLTDDVNVILRTPFVVAELWVVDVSGVVVDDVVDGVVGTCSVKSSTTEYLN